MRRPTYPGRRLHYLLMSERGGWHESIVALAAHQAHGMGQGSEGEGRLSPVRAGNQLYRRAFIRAGRVGTGSCTACIKIPGAGTGSEKYKSISQAM